MKDQDTQSGHAVMDEDRRQQDQGEAARNRSTSNDDPGEPGTRVENGSQDPRLRTEDDRISDR